MLIKYHFRNRKHDVVQYKTFSDEEIKAGYDQEYIRNLKWTRYKLIKREVVQSLFD